MQLRSNVLPAQPAQAARAWRSARPGCPGRAPARREHVARAIIGGSGPSGEADEPVTLMSRRGELAGLAAGVAGLLLQAGAPPPAPAYTGLDYKQEIARRRKKIPLDQFSDGPQGLKFYDIIVGAGAEAKEGARVAVHYDVKYRNVTFVTSRQGLGVTGGTPVGFNVGAEGAGGTLPGIDLGVRGMRVGGLRRLVVPPELAFGSRGVGEIPPNATIMVDVELLSIKTSPLGYRTKLIEG